MSGNLYYFTGPPGTGVEKALKKYVATFPDSSQPEIIKLESKLEKLAKKDLKLLFGVETVTLLQVLRLPKPLLRQLWLKAYNACLKEAQQVRNEGRDAFLTLHACWYQLQNREFVSCVDFARLMKDDAAGAALITLVDDIYDVRARLSVSGEIFGVKIAYGSELDDIVFKLLLILDWRALELVLSERIASLCTKGQHYLLAVKHPIKTLHNLLNPKGKKRVYLSHPIHALREMQAAGGTEARTARETICQIQEVAAALSEASILFEPTTIDDLRFVTLRTQKGPLLIPAVSQRWDLPDEPSELLFTPPPEDIPEFGEQWGGWVEAIQDAARRRKALPHAGHLRVASPLIRTLEEHINMQINSRDHSLVEQSDGLAVYRPFFQGHRSRGVKEELDHHARLVKSGMARAKAIVLHPNSDEKLRKLQEVQALVHDWIGKRILVQKKPSSSRGAVRLSQEQVDAALGSDDALSAARSLEQMLGKSGWTFAGPPRRAPMEREAAVTQEDHLTQYGTQLLFSCGPSYLDEIARAATGKMVILTQDLAPKDFASRVVESLKE